MRARNALWLALTLGACARRGPLESVPPELPHWSIAEIAAHLPPQVKDREGWAADVAAALDALGRRPTPEAVCQVLAVIEQESGFQANPVVPDLARIARRELEQAASRYGPLGRKALEELMDERLEERGQRFGERLVTVRTERDLDLLFRDALRHFRARFPKTYVAANALAWVTSSRGFAEANPVTTAGSMQVSVRFSEALAEQEGKDPASVRDELYTRRGGVHYGTARLLGYEAAYADPLYRFADYNGGAYSSRNAAFQQQLSQLTQTPLAFDGDLLSYDAAGEPASQDSRTLVALLAFRGQFAPTLTERQLRADARKEKTDAFERTATWRAVRRAYEAQTGKVPPYAQVPDVSLKSPKMKKERSTAWFAKSVKARYSRCMGSAEQ